MDCHGGSGLLLRLRNTAVRVARENADRLCRIGVSLGSWETATAVAVRSTTRKNADPAKPVGVFRMNPNCRVPQLQGQSKTAVAVPKLQWQLKPEPQ
jgi:hypothetical protein